MRSYSPQIAAKRLVLPQVAHGSSTYRHPELAGHKITSVLTERAHRSALTVFAKWLLSSSGKHLKNASYSDAQAYLDWRANRVRQSTLSLDRQAINMHCRFIKPLPFAASDIPTVIEDRAYTPQQLAYLRSKTTFSIAFSISLAEDAGLRSMELITLAPLDRLSPSHRAWHPSRFQARENDCRFVVRGKGGLIREIRLAPDLAGRLEDLKRPAKTIITHLTGHLPSYYDLTGGNQFCAAFGRLSKRELGFSNGAHGLRHTFAQRRFLDLICSGNDLSDALDILSQEMGHFATANTLVYLGTRFKALADS